MAARSTLSWLPRSQVSCLTQGMCNSSMQRPNGVDFALFFANVHHMFSSDAKCHVLESIPTAIRKEWELYVNL